MAEAKPKLSTKAKKAIKNLQHVEDGLLHVQATVGTYIGEVQAVKAMFEGDEEAGK
jgi:hypothetical protein